MIAILPAEIIVSAIHEFKDDEPKSDLIIDLDKIDAVHWDFDRKNTVVNYGTGKTFILSLSLVDTMSLLSVGTRGDNQARITAVTMHLEDAISIIKELKP